MVHNCLIVHRKENMTHKLTRNKFFSEHLLTSGTLGPYLLRSRIVMAPMTRNRVAADGVPTPLTVTYYTQRATAALLITEASQVSTQGVGYPNTPGIHSQDQVEGWKNVVDAVHRLGGLIFLQLFHAGRVSHPSLQPGGLLPVAPSPIAPNGKATTYQGLQPFVIPRQLERNEIPGVVEQFGLAAQNARAAGFDGVEIHAANGYLLDQFLRDGSNQRTDEYGGTLPNRLRLLEQVTEAVVAVWSSRQVGVRLSPLNSFNSMKDSEPGTTFRAAVTSLNRYSLAYLHLVEENRSPAAGPNFDMNELRKVWTGTLIVNGGYDRERAEAALASSRADFVSFGRLFIANPDLPGRFKNDAPLNTPDPDSFYGGGERGYIDYPSLDQFSNPSIQKIACNGSQV
jgi:N-ethylmaleimide reductase